VLTKCPAHKQCVVPTHTIVSCNPTLEKIPDLRFVACTVSVVADYGLDIPGGTLVVNHYHMHRIFQVGQHLSFVLKPWEPPARSGRYEVSATYGGIVINGVDYLPSAGSTKILVGTLICTIPTTHDSGWWWFGSSLSWWLVLAALVLGTVWILSYRRYNAQELAGALVREGTVLRNDEDDEEDDDNEERNE